MKYTSLLLPLALLAVGCSKKTESAAPAPAPEQSQPAATTEAANVQASGSASSGPVLQNLAAQGMKIDDSHAVSREAQRFREKRMQHR